MCDACFCMYLSRLTVQPAWSRVGQVSRRICQRVTCVGLGRGAYIQQHGTPNRAQRFLRTRGGSTNRHDTPDVFGQPRSCCRYSVPIWNRCCACCQSNTDRRRCPSGRSWWRSASRTCLRWFRTTRVRSCCCGLWRCCGSIWARYNAFCKRRDSGSWLLWRGSRRYRLEHAGFWPAALCSVGGIEFH